MTLLNWLPEISLIGCLFVSLVVVNFRVLSLKALALILSPAIAAILVYFTFRTDLAFFESPIQVLYSDSLSYFGRLLSLGSLAIFGLLFYFHRELSVRDQQNTSLFLVFNALFISILFQANNLVLFLGAALGMYFCSTSLILIESKKSQNWVRLIRQRTLMFGVWAVVISLFYVLATHLLGSIFMSDWMVLIPKYSGSQLGLILMAFLIILGSVIPLEGALHSGRAPVGLGVLYFGLFLILQVYWLRLGVPFFSTTTLLNRQYAQFLVSFVFGLYTLRYMVQAVRLKDHHRWFAAALPVVLGLSLFLCLLPAERILPVFYCVSLSLLFTFALISHAFLDQEYRQKSLIVVSLIAIMGVPPLILGDQIYRMIHDIVLGGNWVAGILMIVSWFGLVIASMQMLGKILLVRNGIQSRRPLYNSEYFFLGLYLVCVIALTAFRPGLVSLLNDHPISNLW